MTEPYNQPLETLKATRAGVYAALEMHVKRSEALAVELANIDRELMRLEEPEEI